MKKQETDEENIRRINWGLGGGGSKTEHDSGFTFVTKTQFQYKLFEEVGHFDFITIYPQSNLNLS